MYSKNVLMAITTNLKRICIERFKHFGIENGCDNGFLSRDLVMAWAEQMPTESKITATEGYYLKRSAVNLKLAVSQTSSRRGIKTAWFNARRHATIA